MGQDALVPEATISGRNSKLLGLVALGDLMLGLVLSIVGVVSDNQALSIGGVVLLISGGTMLAWVIWSRNRPESW
jgi:hypothetical protein